MQPFLTVPIIGYHHSPLSQKFGIPRQPNLVGVSSHIEFVSPFDTPSAFVGIEQYSHLWVLWQFHHNKQQDNFRPQVRPPRLGGNDKIGVFATRSMYRPSQMGLSVVALDRVEVIDNKVILHIMGADMVDGTPILDIKPYLAFADSISHTIGVDKPTAKQAIFGDVAKLQVYQLIDEGWLIKNDIAIIQELIAQDPRPAYRQDEARTAFSMRYKAVDVDFWMDERGVLVIFALRALPGVSVCD